MRLPRTLPWRLGRRAVLGAALLMAVAAGPTTEPGLAIVGHVRLELRVTAHDLRQMAPVEERVSFLAEHGEKTATYQGVLLWTLLEQAGAFNSSKPRSRVPEVIFVTGRDGFTAALALAELDPSFEDKKVLIAYAADGVALPDGQLRLVLPGDRRGGRSVRDLVRIEVR